MGTVFFILYTVILLLQIVFLIRTIRKRSAANWKHLYIMELVPLVIAAVLAIYYNSLPDPGFLGMSYLGEVLFSMMAAAAYAVMFVVSLIAHVISKWRNKI